MTPILFRRITSTACALCLGFTAFIVPLVLSVHLEDGFELPETLAALMAVVFLALFLSKSRMEKVGDPIHRFYWLYLAAGVLSFLFLSVDVSFYFPTQNYLWLLSAFLFLAPLGGIMPKRKFFAFAVMAGLLGSLYSFAQALGLDLPGWSTHFGGRSFSTLGNPIFWAGHLLILLPLALYLLLSALDKRERFFWLGTMAILFISLVVTQTRGAWLGILGEIVILIFLTRRKAMVWKGLMGAMIVFLLALLTIPSLQERAISILHFHGQDAQGRYFMWNAALKLWDEKKILGQGPGGYAAHFHQAQAELSQRDPFHPYWTALHAHNDYLEVLAERGLVGFVLGGIVLFLLLRRRWKSQEPSEILSAASAEIAIMVGIGIQSLFNFPLSIVPTVCLLAVILNPSWEKVGMGEREEPGIPSNLKVLSRLGLVLIASFAMELFAQNFRLHQAIERSEAQQYEEALTSLDPDPSVLLFHYLDPRLLSQKAVVLDALGRTEEAQRTLNELTEAYPEDAEAHATLCMLYGKQKKWAEAEEEGSKALELSPCHERALTNLAMTSYLQGRKGDAVQYLSRLEQAQRVRGESEKALETQRKILALQKSRS